MSDHDELVPETGYDTPVPELDDHRHQSSTSQRFERPRRGTFDSLYGARHVENESAGPTIRIRDFEEAIVDDDNGEFSPTTRHIRRPTVETTADGRAISPPNSVKAFAQARRRERDMSFSEPKADADDTVSRAMSISSRRSFRSKVHTVNDAASFVSNNTAEEDVCFPHQKSHRKDQLHIDFDYLESFINAERAAHLQSPEETVADVVHDMRTKSNDAHKNQMATIDGDILDMPSDESLNQEKQAAEDVTPPKVATHSLDHNRFSFFSSAWESTIHAAEMGDLVLPGEDIRGLFTLPKDDEDGVWWLNVNGATKDEIYGISKAFGIHPLTIEDIVTQEAREKIELFSSYYFACFRSFNVVEEADGKEYEPFNIYVVVFREGTLSFSFAPNSHAAQVRQRITALKDYVALSSDWICYALV